MPGQMELADKSGLMTDEERRDLQSAILTICDARGNWHYGWKRIVELAGMDATAYPAPFRERSDEQLRELGNGPFSNVRRTRGSQGSEEKEADGNREGNVNMRS